MNWKEYEKGISRYFKETFPNTTIKYDQHIIGKYSKVERQIDILIEGKIAGYSIKIIVDCKYFSKNVDVKQVESFCSMVEDVDGHQGVLITKKGYSQAAINRAFYGNQKVELDILNFDEIKDFQGLHALTGFDDFRVFFPAPFGWIIDAKNKINSFASLYQRGISFTKAQKNNEWMYFEFRKKTDDNVNVISELITKQNKKILAHNSTSTFEYLDDHLRNDEYETKIRIASIEKCPFKEVTGFVEFENVVFFAVLFTPSELIDKNLRKLQYLLSVCVPFKMKYDNSIVINQLLSEIEKSNSSIEKSEKYYKIAGWYHEMNDIQNALLNYRNVLISSPNHYGYLKHQIDFELKFGDKEKAISYSSHLYSLEPKNPTVPNDLIDIFLDNKKGNALIEFFSKEIEDYKDNEIKGNLHFHLGVLQLNMNQKGKARRNFLQAKEYFSTVLDSKNYIFKIIKDALKKSNNGA